jgi:hypothetical protein
MAAQSRLLAALGALSTALVLASEPGEAQQDLARQDASSATTSLTSSAEVQRHFDGLERSLRRSNADDLARLYDDYRASLAALNEENARQNALLLDLNRASHAALRAERLDSAAREQRVREIQGAHAAGTAERQTWHTEKQRDLAARYAADRAESRALLESEISTLHSRMNTALAQLRGGATRVAVPVAVAAGRADSIGAPIGIVTPNC